MVDTASNHVLVAELGVLRAFPLGVVLAADPACDI